MDDNENVSLETSVIHTGVYKDKQFNSVSTPIYQTSTFRAENIEENPEFTYSRFNNPTRKALEENINTLEGGVGAFATSTGTSAILLVLMLLKTGDHIICGREVHGGTYVFIKDVIKRWGIEATFVDLTDPQAVKAAVKSNTKMIWIETPTNPLLSIVDIKAIVEIAKYAEALTVADNTLMTPLWQKPFDYGVDLIIHSTTKYMNGHSDVLGGAVVARTDNLAKELYNLQSIAGLGGAPFDSWLILRGIKTLPHRLKAHEKNAFELANFLNENSLVRKVYYPGFESHPGHEIAKNQQTCFGGMVCFELDLDKVDIHTFFKELKIFNVCYSLGGVESIISHPWTKSHSCMSEEDRLKSGISPGVVRISAGIENSQDLIKDLQDALNIAANLTVTLS